MLSRVSIRWLAVVVVAAVAVFYFGIPGLASRLMEGPEIMPTVEVIEAYPTPVIPTLTSEEEVAAVTVASADERMGQILAGKSYTTTVAVWHTTALAPIGAAVRFTLNQTGTYELDWPYVEYSTDGAPRYPPLTEHYTAYGLRDVTAFVDLRRSEVLQIEPGPETIIPMP